MKKLMIICLTLLVASSAMAQNVNFGPRVALISSEIKLKDPLATITEGDAQIGYQVGLFVRAKFLGLYIQPELLITNSQSVLEVAGTGTVDFEFGKFDVPVMLGYKLGPLRLQAGPTFSFLTKAESTDPGAVAQDIKDNYKSATMGYQAGIGIDIMKFVLDVKYEGNLSAFANALPAGINTDQRQNQIVIALGFKLK